MDLRKCVLSKIEQLGVKEATKFFGVSAGTISNWSSGKTAPSLDSVQLALADSGLEPQQEAKEEEEEVKWEGRQAIILLPVYRTFNADTHFSLFANYAKYGPEKLGMIMQKRTVIHEARNILAQKFLKTDAKYAIMVDDDMIPPCGMPALFNGRYKAGVSNQLASVNAITRLMSHPEDKKIVGALYFGRNSHGKAQCRTGINVLESNDKFRKGKYQGLVPDDWVGTGMVRIHRDVFERIAKEIDNGKWPDIKPFGPKGRYGFFTPLQVTVGEDVSFGLRAKELGIQSYVDAGLVCLHAGEMLFGPGNTTTNYEHNKN